MASTTQPLLPAESSAPTADAGIDAGVEPVFEMADPVAAEPPPSDFAVQIDSIETVEAEADELWDDLGQ